MECGWTARRHRVQAVCTTYAARHVPEISWQSYLNDPAQRCLKRYTYPVDDSHTPSRPNRHPAPVLRAQSADPHTPHSRLLLCSLLTRHPSSSMPMLAPPPTTVPLIRYTLLSLSFPAPISVIYRCSINVSPSPKNGSTVQRATINYTQHSFYKRTL